MVALASYPINLNLANRLCIVLGGGKVAWRKVKVLLESGAKIRVVSPQLIDEFMARVERNEIEYCQKVYEKADLKGSFLVICATDSKIVNMAAARMAHEMGALVNVVDDSYPSDFTVPAQVRRGDLLLTVSTNGKSPEIARQLRKELASVYDESYGEFITLVARYREELKRSVATSGQRERLWREMIDSEVLELVRNGEISIVEARFKNAISGFRVES